MDIRYLASSTIPSAAANSGHVVPMSQAFGAGGHAATLQARRGPGGRAGQAIT